MTGRIIGIAKDFVTGKYHLTLEVNENGECEVKYDKLKDALINIDIKKYRKKRSLDANAYSWVLLDKIAKVLRTSSEEVYELMLERYGYPMYDNDGKAVIITSKSDIDSSLLGTHVKYIGCGTVDGKLFKHYKVIRGQSEYDTKEMSTFIDGIVSEAKELGIETLTPVELERMKASWKA